MNWFPTGRIGARYLRTLSDRCSFDPATAKQVVPSLRRILKAGLTWERGPAGDGGLKQGEEMTFQVDRKSAAAPKAGPRSLQNSGWGIAGELHPLVRALRDFERELHEVVDVIFPGPLGAVVSKFGREERKRAVVVVDLARARWAERSAN